MEAEARSFAFMGNEGIVRIPFFQRGYVWKRDNWEDMFSDLLDENNNHFLGSLILKQQNSRSGDIKEVLVIDGQQRLTTLSILIKALYDLFPEDIQKNCESAFRQHLFYKDSPTDSNYHIKIEHSRIDRKYYTDIIESKIDENAYEKITEKSNKIYQCYKYFKEELKGKDFNLQVKLFNKLLNNKNKILVLIDLGEEEEEQAIFDTINSAGVRLSCSDIIKNALFQKASEVIRDEGKITALYTDKWENVFFVDEDTFNFWGQQRLTGRLVRDNLEILLHSIAVIKGFFDPDKNTLSELSTLYKKYIDEFDEEKLLNFMDEVAKYASIYRNKILSLDQSTIYSYDNHIQRLFHILETCEISTFHPLILFLFYKYNDNDEKLNNYLIKLETFIVRRMIAKLETKSYNKMCKEFINSPDSIQAKIADIPDGKIREGLHGITNKNAALLLFWVELYRRWNDSKRSLKELKYNYSLEHILPQKWENHWDIDTLPVKNDTGEIITDSDVAKDTRGSKCYWLGNMTLLNSSLNSSIKNADFESKLIGSGRKKGIKHYADLSITQDDIVTPFEAGDKIWDEGKIITRTEQLAKEIICIWHG